MVFSRRIAARFPTAGWDGFFENARPLLSAGDIVFGNLETPASLRGTPYPGKDPIITFRAPPGIIFGLKKAGFSVLSLANNHINDYGPIALADTLEALDLAGIARCGAGRNEGEARQPAVVEREGKRFAFLAYVEPMWSATPAGEGPGAAILDSVQVVRDIASAREQADFVVVSLHWGEEHQGTPRESDRALARLFVDAGADAILGHHPHVLQGAEFYRSKPILYSLGNFVFDMLSRRTYETAVAVIEFGPEGPREVRFMPVRIDETSFAPARAVGEDGRAIGRLLAERCAALGSRLEETTAGDYVLRTEAYRTPDSRADSSSSE